MTGASPEFVEAMRLALPGEASREDPRRDPARWALLPGLCCQAAGGDPDQAEEIATAWFLLYLAAHVYDTIQDQDQPDPWWRKLAPGAAINVAAGLMLSGLFVVNNLHQLPELIPVAGDICARFYQLGFQMSGGQHRDLITERPGLQAWFEIAAAKSGSFFGLACWAGARLATDDVGRLDCFYQFGSHLGVLLQVYDDLDDLREVKDPEARTSLKEITRSLPVAYALEVLPEDMRQHLIVSLREASDNGEAARDVFRLLDQSGAALYLKIEIERLQREARAALASAQPDPSALQTLNSYLHSLEIYYDPN